MDMTEETLFSPVAKPWKGRGSANNPWQTGVCSRKSLIDYRQPPRKSFAICHGLGLFCHGSARFCHGAIFGRFRLSLSLSLIIN